MVSKLAILPWRSAGTQFWILGTFLLLVFLTGGSSRPDVQSLVVLRPVAMLVCAFALLSLRTEHIRDNKLIFSCAAALFAIILMHRIPLPNGFVTLFSGMHLNLAIENILGLSGESRPLSRAPLMTSNTIFALFVPLAVLLLVVELDREQRFLLLPLLISLGVLSGLFGILQAVSGYNSSFHLYRLTNEEAAVGLFANRNHQALLLSILFPMLMAFAKVRSGNPKPTRWRSNLAIAAGAVLIPLLLITGSRTGLLVGAICLASLPLFHKKKDFGGTPGAPSRRFNLRFLVIGGVAALLIAATFLAARAEAIKRVFSGSSVEDSRWTIWETALLIGRDSFPMGSGAGSFARMYQLYENDVDLMSGYVNQAHNDWLDVFLTLGIAGIALTVFVVAWIIRLSVSALRRSPRLSRDVIFARLGAIILLSTAVASFFDYPLRTPIFSSICVIACLWLDGIRHAPSDITT